VRNDSKKSELLVPEEPCCPTIWESQNPQVCWPQRCLQVNVGFISKVGQIKSIQIQKGQPGAPTKVSKIANQSNHSQCPTPSIRSSTQNNPSKKTVGHLLTHLSTNHFVSILRHTLWLLSLYTPSCDPAAFPALSIYRLSWDMDRLGSLAHYQGCLARRQPTNSFEPHIYLTWILMYLKEHKDSTTQSRQDFKGRATAALKTMQLEKTRSQILHTLTLPNWSEYSKAKRLTQPAQVLLVPTKKKWPICTTPMALAFPLSYSRTRTYSTSIRSH